MKKKSPGDSISGTSPQKNGHKALADTDTGANLRKSAVITRTSPHPWKIETEPIPENEGGGWCAKRPQFGMSIVSDGETVEEAMAELKNFHRVQFKRYLDEGQDIPEPDAEYSGYSGRFVTRIPQFLHRELAMQDR